MDSAAPAHLVLPPGSAGFPLLGETGDWARDPLRFAQERAARYGLVWRTHLLGRPCIVLLGPEANRFILSTHRHAFAAGLGWGRTITSLIGDGLSFLDGERHRRHRMLLRPALHGAAITRFIGLMERTIEGHVAEWLRQSELRLFDGLKQLSFAVATTLFLGLADQAQVRAMERIFRAFSNGLFAPPAWRIPGLPYNRAWVAGQQLRQILRAAIVAHRDAPQPTVLGMLLEARDSDGHGLSDEELLDELLVLLWAGHDTMTSLLTWTMYELLHNPQILAASRAEQAAVVGTGPLMPEQLGQLPLLDRVLRETERLHPPAPGGFRGVVADVAYAGYHIPRGWTVMYSSVFTHRMPELWREPDRFDPDRFAPPRAEGHKPFHLIGFGGGPRFCVGYAFAQLQMRMVLVHLLRDTELKLVPYQRFQPIAVPISMPRDGLVVRIRSAHRGAARVSAGLSVEATTCEGE